MSKIEKYNLEIRRKRKWCQAQEPISNRKLFGKLFLSSGFFDLNTNLKNLHLFSILNPKIKNLHFDVFDTIQYVF